MKNKTNKNTEPSLSDRFFEDKSGKIVIAQSPNPPLIGWALFMILSRIGFLDQWSGGLEALSFGCLFVWAYLEITDGVNYFRRMLGLLVLIMMVWNRF